MRVGLIPPLAHLGTFGRGEFHLLLDHLCVRKEYLAHYRSEREKGAFLLLDNSAHEFKTGAQALRLLQHGALFPANEIVATDVLWKAMDTLETTTKAMESWVETEDNRQLFLSYLPRIMFVPQGEDEQAWRTCLFGQMMKWQRMHRAYPEFFVEPPTIGISKDYEVWDGGIAKLLQDHILPLHLNEKVQVHLLGWGRELWELNHLARLFPWIRSTDSAKPFVFAKHDILLDPVSSVPPAYPTRDKDYFDWTLNLNQVKIAGANVSTFRRLAHGAYEVVQTKKEKVR
jgi:hypothetical protein